MTFKKENYTTTLVRAKQLVPGFKEAFIRFEERLVLDQCSKSMFSNYGRNLAHLVLHFGRVPHEVSVDEINAYLYRLTVHDKLSVSFLSRLYLVLDTGFDFFGLEHKALQMPVIKEDKTLPTVLSKEECRALFSVSRCLKHRFLLAFAYAGGLRMNELRHVKISDVDLDRKQVKIRLGKGKRIGM